MWERSRASEARLTRTEFAPDRDLEVAPTARSLPQLFRPVSPITRPEPERGFPAASLSSLGNCHEG